MIIKKFFLSVIIFVLLFPFFIRSEYQVSSKIKDRIDGLMNVVEIQWGKESKINQLNKYQKIIDSFSKVRLEWEQKEMIDYLLYLFKIKANELRGSLVNQEDVIPNIDWKRIEETWLQWHNEERNKIWLWNYKINDSLNYSALVWANELANMNKTSYTHTRNSWDWYYNYDKILDRFNNIWVSFDYNWTAFTENVAYQYYGCSKSDCTQDLINAMKKWFDFFMSEKSWNWAHYRAIIHPYFTDLWFWVWVSWKRYRVVTHYWINVE